MNTEFEKAVAAGASLERLERDLARLSTAIVLASGYLEEAGEAFERAFATLEPTYRQSGPMAVAAAKASLAQAALEGKIQPADTNAAG